MSGINGGAGVVNSALAGVGSALQVGNQAFGFVENGFTNQANFFGALGNAAFSNAQNGIGSIIANRTLGGVNGFSPYLSLPGNIASSGYVGQPGGLDTMRFQSAAFRNPYEYSVSTGISPPSGAGVGGVGTGGFTSFDDAFAIYSTWP